MQPLIIKRHKLKFYLSVVMVFLAFLSMGTAMFFVFIKHAGLGELKAKEYLMPVFGVGIYFLAFYTVYRYFKNAPMIQIDKDAISFDDQIFALKDIIHIELTGKKSFPYIIGFPMEAATLTFKDGNTKIIFDDMYENAWQLKSFLQQATANEKEFIEFQNRDIKALNLVAESYETYNGSQMTSLRGILLWSTIGVLLYILFSGKRQPSVGIIIVVSLNCLFWFFIFSWMMHYFKVSQDYLVVKNQNLFWITKTYRIDDINEIVFETRQKMPNCLRVITKDFKSKFYPAGVLRDKTWLEMKDKLESLGLTVRNECI